MRRPRPSPKQLEPHPVPLDARCREARSPCSAGGSAAAEGGRGHQMAGSGETWRTVLRIGGIPSVHRSFDRQFEEKRPDTSTSKGRRRSGYDTRARPLRPSPRHPWSIMRTLHAPIARRSFHRARLHHLERTGGSGVPSVADVVQIGQKVYAWLERPTLAFHTCAPN